MANGRRGTRGGGRGSGSAGPSPADLAGVQPGVVVTDPGLRPEGMRALKAERAKNAQLRHQLTSTRKELRRAQRQVKWLSRTVLRASNRMVDTLEAVALMDKEEG